MTPINFIGLARTPASVHLAAKTLTIASKLYISDVCRGPDNTCRKIVIKMIDKQWRQQNHFPNLAMQN